MKSRLKKLPNDKILLSILIALSAFAAHSLLRSGHPRLGDAWAHLARTQIIFDAIKQFTIPYWDFKIYYGFPFLKFYSPAYYYIAAIFTLLTGGNLIFGTKLLLFISHILSAVTMFIFVRKFLKNGGAAFVAGLACAFSFWHLYQILAMSRYPVALIYVFAPLCFWAVINYNEKQTIKRALIMGGFWGIALLIHPQYGIFSIFFSLVFFVPYLKTLKLAPMLWGIVSMLCLSGFSILPFFLEGQKYLNLFSTEKYVSVSLIALLEWSKNVNRYGNWLMGEYLGLSIVILAIIGLMKTMKDSIGLKLPLLVGLLCCLLFIFGLDLPGFESFYRLVGMMPKRFLLFFIMILSVFAGNGYLYIIKRYKNPAIFLLMVSIIILADLAPTALQSRCYPPKSFVMKNRDLVYANVTRGYVLADLGEADSSMFDFGRLLYYPGMQSIYSKNPSPYGYYYQFASKPLLYSYPWLNMLAQEQKIESPDSISSLNDKIAELLNLKYVVYEDKERGAGLGTFENISPIIISGKLLPWPDSRISLVGQYCYADDYKQLLDSMFIDTKLATASKLWARGIKELIVEGFEMSRPIVSQFDLHQNTAQITIETRSPCFARIPLSYYPDIKIYINGVRCPKMYESADHFMIVQLDKGVSKIDVIPTRSTIEIVSLYLSGICLVAVSVVLYRERKSRKRYPR